MDFFAEITRLTGLPVEEALQGFRVTLVSGRACYIMRHTGIVEFSSECVIFKAGKRRLVVRGEGLTIKNLTHDDAVVIGEIAEVKAEK
jgi:sporulation protein YqfC